jgi:hypothetical protein
MSQTWDWQHIKPTSDATPATGWQDWPCTPCLHHSQYGITNSSIPPTILVDWKNSMQLGVKNTDHKKKRELHAKSHTPTHTYMCQVGLISQYHAHLKFHGWSFIVQHYICWVNSRIYIAQLHLSCLYPEQPAQYEA